MDRQSAQDMDGFELAEKINLVTDADIQHFRTEAVGWFDEKQREALLGQLNRDLVDFWRHGDLVRWTLILLHSLSETVICYDEQPDDLEDEINVEAVRDRFEADFRRELDEAIQRWAVEHDDPKHAWRWTDGKPSEHNHPWGAECVGICRWLLNLTPYRIWRVYKHMQGWGRDCLEETLTQWATGCAVRIHGWSSQGSGCVEKMQRDMEHQFDKQVELLQQEYRRWHRKQVNEAGWDEAALPTGVTC